MQRPQIDFRALYNSQIAEYIERRNPHSHSAQRIALEVTEFKIPNLISVLPPGFRYKTIGEIGCATGEIVANFPGADVSRRVGFDLSELNVECATNRFPNTTFVADPAQFYRERYDLVILSDILEHVPDDAQLLREASKVAKILLINLPLEKCLTYMFRRYGPEDPSGHLRWYSPSDGLRLFDRADLDVLARTRVWVMETRYELMRQQLNRQLLGASFNGGWFMRGGKTLFFNLCNAFQPVGRLMFPSNLFASLAPRAK
jgi:SAM-dependent methyltransferase